MTDQDTNSARDAEVLDWTGWVVAYVTISGPVRDGYIGKYVGDAKNGAMVLDPAYEFASVTAAAGRGNLTRSTHGMPIEFTTITSVEVLNPKAVLRLDGLDHEQLRGFEAARREAVGMAQSLKPGRPHQPRIVLPGT